jgi:K+-transporting ATPase ATPase A chain
VQAWLQIGLILLTIFLLSIPVGRYLANIVMGRRIWSDRIFDTLDNGLYLAIGRTATSRPMNWQTYTFHMLAANFFMAAIIYLILVFQGRLPRNPMHFPGMGPVLAFNTAISFITDWRSYAGNTSAPHSSAESGSRRDAPRWR